MNNDTALIGAIDQGTSSTRFLVFSAKDFQLITYHQVPIKLISDQAGWVEIDPDLIISSVIECIEKVCEYLNQMGISHSKIKAVGLTNQRETTILWDKLTGRPLYNAIVWLDTRTHSTVDELLRKCNKNPNCLKEECGLPISTYFSALKIKWLIDHVVQVKTAIKEDRCAFGTVDSWILWNLVGNNSTHLTDVTNASRTMLMNLKTLNWDDELCNFFNVPKSILPEIKSSADHFGYLNRSSLKDVPITSVLGDQQAALVGQLCWKKGSAKNTYGTGCFLLYNTGNEIVYSTHGLITTVAYKFGNDKPIYALEGSVAIAGAALNWLRDNLEILPSASKSEEMANEVKDTGDVYFVPAFSGLFAPHWRPDARGYGMEEQFYSFDLFSLIIGITQYTTKSHIVRAALEAVAFQNLEIVESMNKDSGISLKELQVDGGMTENKLLMQMQADVLGIPVIRQSMTETTSFGAALAAGHTIGLWNLNDEPSIPIIAETFNCSISKEVRDLKYSKWKKAVEKSMGWDESPTVASKSFLQSLADEPIKFLFILSMPIATAYVFLKLLHK